MSDGLICKKHNVKLECMGGRSAHRGNWYCPVCYLTDTNTADDYRYLADEAEKLVAALEEIIIKARKHADNEDLSLHIDVVEIAQQALKQWGEDNG